MMGPHAFRLPKADINGHIQVSDSHLSVCTELVASSY